MSSPGVTELAGLPAHPPSPRREAAGNIPSRRKHWSQHRRRVGYLRQHWRGDLPLAAAVIISAALVWGAVQAISYVSSKVPITDYPVYSSLLWLLEVFVVITGALWWGTGVQRSAIESVDRGGSLMVAALTGIVGLGAFVWVAVFWFQSARYVMPEVWSTLIGSSPPAAVLLDTRRNQIVLQGGLEFGSTRAVRAALDANPNVRVVRLESRGGRVAEGLALGTLLRDRNVDTFVNDGYAAARASPRLPEAPAASSAPRRRWVCIVPAVPVSVPTPSHGLYPSQR